MKILCWNVQGAKKFQLQQEVGFINRTIKSDILILLETMVNMHNAVLIVKRLGFQNYSTIPPQDHVGGMWLPWNADNGVVNIIAKEARIIHCTVFDKINSNQCMLSAIYAPAQEHEKMFLGITSSI